MIAQNTLRVDYEINNAAEQAQPIYLAPFGEADLAQVTPLNTDGLYFPRAAIDLYAQDPAALVATHENLEHSQDWGIFQGEVSPEAFQGVAQLNKTKFGGARYRQHMQETGLYVMRPDGRQKGLGGIARLAMMTYAVENQGTRAFRTLVSERNSASQKSLTRAGFVLLETIPNCIDFPDGEATQHWAAAHPHAQHSVASSSAQADALAAGWQRYETQRQQLNITEL